MGQGLEKSGDELYCPTCEQTYARGERCPADNTRLVRIAGSRDQLIGRDLDGRYTITEQLGAGGMGAVYRGTQHQLGREVAIKVVTPTLVKEPLVIKRFLREAKLASRLSHPNAVSVLDFGQTEDGLFFLVMELVRGRTLEQVVLDEKKLSPARVVRIGTQICDALEGAHAMQIIHRDLKPQNVMLMSTGRDLVKVLDFGLAKSLSPEQGKTTMTNAGALLGTPAFMPPELVHGHEVDARSDLYSLGCLLYVCASGRLPFPSTSVHEVIAMHMSDPAARIESIPYRLWRVIERLLEKDPANRYQSATETREALEGALAERPDTETEEESSTLVAESSTKLGWAGASGVATAPGKRGEKRIATPIGIQQLSKEEVDIVASSATLPSDVAAQLVVRRPQTKPIAPTARKSPFSWKAIAAVAAAALAAGAIAFVLFDGSSKNEPEAPPPPPAVSTPPPPPPIAPVVAPTPADASVEQPVVAPPVEAKPEPKKTVKAPVKSKAPVRPTETKSSEPAPRRPVKVNPGVM